MSCTCVTTSAGCGPRASAVACPPFGRDAALTCAAGSRSWLAPRDVCLLRHWRSLPDGSLLTLTRSTTHRQCPVVRECVRALDAGSAIAVAPRPQYDAAAGDASVVAYMARVEPKGWAMPLWGVPHAFTEQLLRGMAGACA